MKRIKSHIQKAQFETPLCLTLTMSVIHPFKTFGTFHLAICNYCIHCKQEKKAKFSLSQKDFKSKRCCLNMLEKIIKGPTIGPCGTLE